jgi:peroxiredoxin Q/BCP
MIKAGEAAPSWSGAIGGGKLLRSEDYLGQKHVILYFFPKDFTPG